MSWAMEPWGQMIGLSIVVYIEKRRGPNTEPWGIQGLADVTWQFSERPWMHKWMLNEWGNDSNFIYSDVKCTILIFVNAGLLTFRMTCLSAICLTQAWMMWKFINFQLKKWREQSQIQASKKKAVSPKSRPSKKDSRGESFLNVILHVLKL